MTENVEILYSIIKVLSDEIFLYTQDVDMIENIAGIYKKVCEELSEREEFFDSILNNNLFDLKDKFERSIQTQLMLNNTTIQDSEINEMFRKQLGEIMRPIKTK